MQFLLQNWYLVLAALVSGAALVWPAIAKGGGGAHAVSTSEAVRMINRERAVVIDVGEPAEYAAGHVAGARSVPFQSIEAPAEGKEGRDARKGLPSNKTAALIVVCPTGSRSARAAGMLQRLGYANARSLAGGLGAWRQANLPIEKSA